MAMNPAKRRYLLRSGTAMALYVGSLFAADYLIEDVEVSREAAIALALLPGLAIVGFIWALGMAIVEQKDEFLRMVAVRQMLIATGFALSVASVWGFLEEYLLVKHVESFWVFVIWALGLAIGAVVTRITHGSWGECW